MEEWIKVVILGIIEGITEFLPISSTGHLIVTSTFLELRESLRGTFEIFIQLGAVFAVLAYYRNDFIDQIKNVTHDRGVQRLWFNVVIACIPAAVLGLLFNDWITEKLFSPTVVAIALIIGGVIFIIVERSNMTQREEKAESLQELTTTQAFLIGLFQCLALIPGASRSGSSIIGGLLVGVDRQTATQFSFYLAIPILGGATVYEFLRSMDEFTGNDVALLIGGMIVSGIVAWFAIGWLLRYVSNNDFVAFGIYRILMGAIILLLLWGNAL